ncbi:MAG: 3-keto-5-aminohexanoate cleavage protein [Paracoccaceae bacterium]
MPNPVWLEAAINGPWSRTRQPLIPITADEIVADAIACADAGAAILHFHPYDEATGLQKDSYDIYAPIIERIRAARDVICYGTLPFAGDLGAETPQGAAQRFDAVEKLAKAGLIEWSVVDPGSTNISDYEGLNEGREGFVYANPEAHLRYGLSLARTFGIVPSYAIYEPGFLRLGAALSRLYPGAPVPVYRFMFSQQMTFGFPPEPYALEAYLKLLATEAPNAPWMVAGLGVEIDPLIELAIAKGGHVRVGLEDAPLGTDTGNLTRTAAAAKRILALGRQLASADDVRADLANRKV